MAGTVAAAANNDRGVVGIAHGARIMPVRVMGYQQGTSMAAPHVAGTVALMKQLVDFALTDGAGEWRSDLGFGLLNAARALDAAVSLGGGELRDRVYFEGGRSLKLWRAQRKVRLSYGPRGPISL